MIYSLAIAIAQMCSSNFFPGGLDKLQCQDKVAQCVLIQSKPLDSNEHKDRMIL